MRRVLNSRHRIGSDRDALAERAQRSRLPAGVGTGSHPCRELETADARGRVVDRHLEPIQRTRLVALGHAA
jgi:hypothetical protein